MSFTNFTTGTSHSFGGTYIELTPHERIRYTDRFDDPNVPGEMHVTVELKKVACGTELHITQEGVPAVIAADGCYLDWQNRSPSSLNWLTLKSPTGRSASTAPAVQVVCLSSPKRFAPFGNEEARESVKF